MLRDVAANNGVALLFGTLSNNSKSHKISVEVKAAYEIVPSNVHDALAQELRDLAASPVVTRLLRLSRRLGMRVVGCSVGNKTLGSSGNTWCSDHVLAALQLRNLSSSPNDFVVLRDC